MPRCEECGVAAAHGHLLGCETALARRDASPPDGRPKPPMAMAIAVSPAELQCELAIERGHLRRN